MTDAKELIIFDLDGTIAVSKMPPDEEIAELLCVLLSKRKVAVISGASFKQFEIQFLKNLPCSLSALARLYLMPTNGSSMYQFADNKWKAVYEELLSIEERKKIREAFNQAISEAGIKPPEKVYGEIIEDRESQLTYSALGQEAPIEAKSLWDPDHKIREKIKEILQKRLPDFEIRIGGTTSIDVTKKGIDKAYGIKKLAEHLSMPLAQIQFVGDALFPGGNDYPAREIGVETVEVSDPEETKKVIRELLSDSEW